MEKKNMYVKVITDKGIKQIHHILPGDKVYNAFTGEPMEVVLLPENLGSSLCFMVTYEDGRISCHSKDDDIIYQSCIINGARTVRTINPEDLMRFGLNDSHKIDYPPVSIESPYITWMSQVDPYLAGAMLTYGDIEDRYINVQSSILDKLDKSQNILEYVSLSCPQIHQIVISADKLYFADMYGNTLSWTDVFGRTEFHDLSYHAGSHIKDWIYASYKSKLQFIRGVLDIGFSSDRSTNEYVGIMMNDHSVAIGIRLILLSMGVPSRIRTNQMLGAASGGMAYTLQIPTSYSANLFYNRKYIESVIDIHSDLWINNSEFNSGYTRINSIKPLNVEIDAYDIVLKDGPSYYLTENFLPRISL